MGLDIYSQKQFGKNQYISGNITTVSFADLGIPKWFMYVNSNEITKAVYITRQHFRKRAE